MKTFHLSLSIALLGVGCTGNIGGTSTEQTETHENPDAASTVTLTDGENTLTVSIEEEDGKKAVVIGGLTIEVESDEEDEGSEE